jgi:hypothetical protein
MVFAQSFDLHDFVHIVGGVRSGLPLSRAAFQLFGNLLGVLSKILAADGFEVPVTQNK